MPNNKYAIVERLDHWKGVTEQTGFKDMNGTTIMEGDICVGKSDRMHPFKGDDIKVGIERDYVRRNLNDSAPGWIWNGSFLRSTAPNLLIVGNIFDNPDLLLW